MAEDGVGKLFPLSKQGIENNKQVFWNLPAPKLYEHAILRQEAQIAKDGPLVADTGKYTGRSPNDKFIIEDEVTKEKVWWGDVNRGMSEENFNKIKAKVFNHVKERDLFVQDCFAGTNPQFQVPIRVVTEFAWQSLFARNMFVRIEDQKALNEHQPEYTVICVPTLKLNPAEDNTHSEAFILPNFKQKLILIGGTHYAGEIKKSVFTLLNFLLPQKGTLSMHCSANTGNDGDVAIFFGLSGTGKTTLSADPERHLIGDDEHGWSDDGVFNFEGGCYAKAIRLSPTAEPEIFATTQRFGTILENVVIDPVTREKDFDDNSKTENTRASYPAHFIPNVVEKGYAGHPQNIIMLTCDAFGVLPPVAKLTPSQAMYHFLSGYTAKVAGTERGIKEPQATFSACFGAPFMALHPGVYAKLLGEKIAQHNAHCWLVNTGWSGGAYGVGSRVSIADSRAIIRAILNGELAKANFKTNLLFGFSVPENCPGVSSASILEPQSTWSDATEYENKAKHLANLFIENFKQFEAGVAAEILQAGPKL